MMLQELTKFRFLYKHSFKFKWASNQASSSIEVEVMSRFKHRSWHSCSKFMNTSWNPNFCGDKQNFIKMYNICVSHIIQHFPQKEIISITTIQLHFISISWLFQKPRFDLRQTPISNLFPFSSVHRNRYRATIFRIGFIYRGK